MTDARNRAGLADAIARLPRGSAVVFRDGDLPREERRRHFRRVARLCAGKHLLLVAGEPVRGDWRAVGRHNSRRRDRPLHSMAVHDTRQAAEARRRKVDASLVSPVFLTRSHPGARVLGRWGFAALARRCPGGVIALGRLTSARFRRLRPLGADGWAAIEGLAGRAR